MIDKLTLRQLINRLEILSKGGKNDNMEVDVFFSSIENDFMPVRRAYIDAYISPNEEEFGFIRIECYEEKSKVIKPLKPENCVFKNNDRDKSVYPYAYSLNYNGTSYYGITKTKQEALNYVKSILEGMEGNL